MSEQQNDIPAFGAGRSWQMRTLKIFERGDLPGEMRESDVMLSAGMPVSAQLCEFYRTTRANAERTIATVSHLGLTGTVAVVMMDERGVPYGVVPMRGDDGPDELAFVASMLIEMGHRSTAFTVLEALSEEQAESAGADAKTFLIAGEKP
jgi:hypothetical protein